MSRIGHAKSSCRSMLLSLLVIGILFSAVSAVPSVAVAAPDPPDIKADGYLVTDFKTGRVLMSKNPDQALIPASLTKIMSMYVLFDAIKAGSAGLDDMVKVSELAWSTGGSKMFILVGSEVKLEDLVKGVTVMSGNDACVALAEHVAGSVTAFVNRMNEKAISLGLTATHFVDPHGLSDDNRTSASDLAKLVTSYALMHPDALPYHGLKEFTYTAPGETQKAPQFNRNRLLWSYPGTYGLKTGFTTLAGFNTVVLCERDGLDVLLTIMGSARGMSMDAGERERTALVTSMLDWTFANYTYVSKATKGTVLGQVRAWKGKDKFVDAVAPYDLGATVERGQENSVTQEVTLRDDLEAPLTSGTKVGEIVFSVDSVEIGRADLLAGSDVAKGSVFRVIWDALTRAISRAFSSK